MTTLYAVQKDVNDSRDILLQGVTSLASVASVEGHVWKAGQTAAVLTATIDVPSRVVTVQFGGVGGWLDTAAVGKWWFEIQVNFVSGAKLTWPEAGPDEIHVRAQGA